MSKNIYNEALSPFAFNPKNNELKIYDCNTHAVKVFVEMKHATQSPAQPYIVLGKRTFLFVREENASNVEKINYLGTAISLASSAIKTFGELNKKINSRLDIDTVVVEHLVSIS